MGWGWGEMCYSFFLGGHASLGAANPVWSCRPGKPAFGVSSGDWTWIDEEREVLSCTLTLFTDCRYPRSILHFP